jgi:hypothetical protein
VIGQAAAPQAQPLCVFAPLREKSFSYIAPTCHPRSTSQSTPQSRASTGAAFVFREFAFMPVLSFAADVFHQLTPLLLAPNRFHL